MNIRSRLQFLGLMQLRQRILEAAGTNMICGSDKMKCTPGVDRFDE